jgi:hypothetical protein
MNNGDNGLSAEPESTAAMPGASMRAAEFQQRAALYGMSLFGVAMLAGSAAAPAQAQIVTVVPTSTLIATPGGPPIVLDFLNGTAGFNTDGATQPGQFALYIQSFSRAEGDPIIYHYNTGFVKPGPRGSVVGVDGSAFRLKAGYVINGSDSFTRGRARMFSTSYRQFINTDDAIKAEISGSHFDTHSYGSWGRNSPKNEGFLGFSFTFGDPQTDYGWANITIIPDIGIELGSFGYDPSGAPIGAGANDAPDANPLLLLVVGGAAAMAAYRTRRRESALAVH